MKDEKINLKRPGNKDVKTGAVRNKKGQFVKGAGSPNPGGRPKRVQELEEFFNDKSLAAAQVLFDIMLNDNEPSKVRVTCANSILDRSLGKPKQQTEIITPTNINDFITPIVLPYTGKKENE